MALTLTITGQHDQGAGLNNRHVFDASARGIDCGQVNLWLSPDPECYISGNYPTISRAEAAWYLTDTIINGVYGHDAFKLVGKGNTVSLHEGGHLKFCDNEIEIFISGDVMDRYPTDSWSRWWVAVMSNPFKAGYRVVNHQ